MLCLEISHEGILDDQGDPRELFAGYGLAEEKILDDQLMVYEEVEHEGEGPHVVTGPVAIERAPAGVAPLAVGFALACGVLIAGPITGGPLNPARTLGPMVMAGQFTAVWVYIVGPIVGAVLAALAYDRFASQSDATE